VTWPAGLQSLSVGRDYNQSLDNVTWPAGLQSLSLGYRFNQSLDNVSWPAGLQFNQSLYNVKWPAGLKSLSLAEDLEDLDVDVDLNLVDDIVFLLSRAVLPNALCKLVVGQMLLMC